MKNSSLFFQILALLLFFNTFTFAQMPKGDEAIMSSDTAFEQELMRLVNAERAKRRMKALQWDENLARAARYHANDMLVDGYFEHESYDKKNGRLKRIGDTFERINKFTSKPVRGRSENIGAGQSTAAEMVKVWMKSSGHRQNILDKEAKYIGVGYVYSDDDEFGHYWVMDAGY